MPNKQNHLYKFLFQKNGNFKFFSLDQAKSAASTAQNYASQAASKAREGKLI